MNRPPTRPRMALVALAATALMTLAGAQAPKKKVDIPKLIELHNAARAKEKLGPLAANPKLEAAAKVQAKDQADRGKMDHTGGDGSTPAQRIERQEYRFRGMGENVAMGQTSSAEVFEAWMNSPHHKDNILGDFAEIGAACYADADGVNYWCVTFGKPWPKVEPEAASSGMIDALNAARKAEGLPPLATHRLLEEAAMRHARDMAEAKTFLAKDSDDEVPTSRAQKAGYAAKSIGQVDAIGQVEPAKAVQSWLDSDASKKLLMGDHRDVGVGIATDADGVPYWTVLVGQPRAAEPEG